MRAVVVVPCFDEGERLPVAAFESFLRSEPSIGFVLVNDGSRDATLELLESLKHAVPDRVHVLDLPHNCGKAEAVRRGVLVALELEPDLVGYWDADLATPLREIPSFCALLDERPALLLLMSERVRLLRREFDRSAVRHYTGRVGAMAISLTLRLSVYDSQCGAKILRVTHETRALFDEPFHPRWLFDVELIARLLYARCRTGCSALPSDIIQGYPLTEWKDAAGSKVRPWDYLRSALALVGIRRRYLRGGGRPA